MVDYRAEVWESGSGWRWRIVGGGGEDPEIFYCRENLCDSKEAAEAQAQEWIDRETIRQAEFDKYEANEGMGF